ncbi:MAG TPA: hypothetical protein DCE80_00295 [Ignavibacteriales bacterium]|nr:hypothetical protein [Ignavibacteriales bacterium]
MNIFLTIYFWITVIILGIYAIVFGNTIFFNTEYAFLLMILGAIFIAIEIIFVITIIILSLLNKNFKNLKSFVVYLPWIMMGALILPFISLGRELRLYYSIVVLIFYCVFIIYIISHFLKEQKLIKSAKG